VQSNGIQLNSVSVEQGEGGFVSLTVEVAPQSVQTARERVIKEFSKRLKVPGFRPGSIPAGIVRRNRRR
jgi:FKBP-type peptidyl-prolyl cis-trans isomerase (trigger factor)